MGKLLLCLLALSLTGCAYYRTVTVQPGQTIRWTPAGEELMRTSADREPQPIPEGMDVYHASFGEVMTVRSSAGEDVYSLELERVVIMRNGDVFLDDCQIAIDAEEVLIQIPAVTEVQNIGYGETPWYETLSAATTGTLLFVLTIPLWMYGEIASGQHFSTRT